MFFTWSLAEAWSWLVNLPCLGALVLCLSAIAIILCNWERITSASQIATRLRSDATPAVIYGLLSARNYRASAG